MIASFLIQHGAVCQTPGINMLAGAVDEMYGSNLVPGCQLKFAVYFYQGIDDRQQP